MESLSAIVEAITGELGLDAQAIETRKAFVGLGDSDLPPLRRLHQVLHDLGPEFSHRFYDHLLAFPQTRRFIQDTQALERLQQLQTRYFEDLTAGDYGADYIHGRLRVGVVHQRIGLDPTWYLGAYAKYLVELIPQIAQRLGDKGERIAAMQALVKIVFFDIGLAIETYAHADRQHILALRRYGELVFAAMPLALAVLTDDLSVEAINPAFGRLFGLNEAQATARPLAALLPSEALAAKLQEVLLSGTALQDLSWERAPAAAVPALACKVSATRFLTPQGAPRVLLMVQDVTERKAAEARIAHLAFYDALTDLPNRALFLNRLQHELAAAERRGQPLALLFLDLNRFKEINDTLGHEVGDRVLVEVARRLRAALREEEMLARLSGDEFIVLIQDKSEAAARAAERLTQALGRPISVGAQAFAVSASIGIAVFPEDGRTSEELLKAADIAMYRAKGNGGRYQFYQREMGQAVARRLLVAQRLDHALRAGQLELHYQPQVDLSNGRLIGAEALARWPDPEWGMVSPAEFIPIAEERGLAVPLGEWALDTACRQLRQWQDTGCPAPFRLAVNVSAKQFEDDGFVETVIRTAHEKGVAPRCMELELTESAMVKDPQRAVDVVEALRAAGFALSIDDFGTGYSSLAYLMRFRVHKLKIDLSFVRNMLDDAGSHSIVSTIIAMGRSLGLETLAEGVEHARQVDRLLALGCRQAQGYLFDRPQPAETFNTRWLKAAR